MSYKVYYYEKHLEIIEPEPRINGMKFPPKTICKAEKLADIPEDIFDVLSEYDTETIYYFFFDLETVEE